MSDDVDTLAQTLLSIRALYIHVEGLKVERSVISRACGEAVRIANEELREMIRDRSVTDTATAIGKVRVAEERISKAEAEKKEAVMVATEKVASGLRALMSFMAPGKDERQLSLDMPSDAGATVFPDDVMPLRSALDAYDATDIGESEVCDSLHQRLDAITTLALTE